MMTTRNRRWNRTPDSDELKELKSIKKLLVLIALKNGASLDEIDKATGMGVSHISELFPRSKREKAPSNVPGTSVEVVA